MVIAIGAMLTLILALALMVIFRARGRSGCGGIAAGLTIGALLTYGVQANYAPYLFPTPAPTPDPIIGRARQLCTNAFANPVAGEQPPVIYPAAWWQRWQYKEHAWSWQGDQTGNTRHGGTLGSGDVTDQTLAAGKYGWSGQEPAALACIQESREVVHSYYDTVHGVRLAEAYRRVWTVRLVNWADESVIANGVFRGSNGLPEQKVCVVGEECDEYGTVPDGALTRWLEELGGTVP